MLKLCIDNITEDFQRINERLRIKRIPNLSILISNERDVNLRLFLCELIEKVNLDDTGMIPAFTTGFIVGSSSKKGVRYNDKGENCNRVVRFIDECTKRYDLKLSTEGKRQVDGMISEILNNAEDHSPLNAYYINANFSASQDMSDNFDAEKLVGEVNVTIMNFGDSIYDGLERTKVENENMYTRINEFVEQIRAQDSKQTKDNLFTLYALQDGVSRLKYKDKSRGTGTMKFITSFFELGGYESKAQNYIPRLSILSGNTAVYINNHCKPFTSDMGFCIMPLNEQNDLELPPSKKNLVTLNRKFPGTLLSARVFLHKEHMLKFIGN